MVHLALTVALLSWLKDDLLAAIVVTNRLVELSREEGICRLAQCHGGSINSKLNSMRKNYIGLVLLVIPGGS